MVGIPAGVDAAAMMQLLVLRNGAAKELPAEPVGVAVLCLGDAGDTSVGDGLEAIICRAHDMSVEAFHNC
jgi:hypothetical protein